PVEMGVSPLSARRPTLQRLRQHVMSGKTQYRSNGRPAPTSQGNKDYGNAICLVFCLCYREAPEWKRAPSQLVFFASASLDWEWVGDRRRGEQSGGYVRR